MSQQVPLPPPPPTRLTILPTSWMMLGLAAKLQTCWFIEKFSSRFPSYSTSLPSPCIPSIKLYGCSSRCEHAYSSKDPSRLLTSSTSAHTTRTPPRSINCPQVTNDPNLSSSSSTSSRGPLLQGHHGVRRGVVGWGWGFILLLYIDLFSPALTVQIPSLPEVQQGSWLISSPRPHHEPQQKPTSRPTGLRHASPRE